MTRTGSQRDTCFQTGKKLLGRHGRMKRMKQNTCEGEEDL